MASLPPQLNVNLLIAVLVRPFSFVMLVLADRFEADQHGRIKLARRRWPPSRRQRALFCGH
jgi:hypothetical protein